MQDVHIRCAWRRGVGDTWRTLGSDTFDAGTATVTLEVRNPDLHRTSAVRFLPLAS